MNRYLAAAAAAVALMLVAAAFIFLFAPTDALQGPVQRIFYLHVTSAIAAFVSFAVVVVGSVAYLWRESIVGDRVARSAALVGVVFTTVTLVMGMMWAKPIWGTFWTWDARLTSTLVLWIIYAGYLLVRIANSACPYSTGWPLLTMRFAMMPEASDSISFISFMASMMQRICPVSTWSPTLKNGGEPGEGDS